MDPKEMALRTRMRQEGEAWMKEREKVMEARAA